MVKKIFNPWEAKGDIDYKKLVKEFGISPINQLPKVFEKELLFKRKIIFGKIKI